jgi:hypothetical protein
MRKAVEVLPAWAASAQAGSPGTTVMLFASVSSNGLPSASVSFGTAGGMLVPRNRKYWDSRTSRCDTP